MKHMINIIDISGKAGILSQRQAKGMQYHSGPWSLLRRTYVRRTISVVLQSSTFVKKKKKIKQM